MVIIAYIVAISLFAVGCWVVAKNVWWFIQARRNALKGTIDG